MVIITKNHLKEAAKRILKSGGPDLSFYFKGELSSTSIDVNNDEDADQIDVCLTEFAKTLSEILGERDV